MKEKRNGAAAGRARKIGVCASTAPVSETHPPRILGLGPQSAARLGLLLVAGSLSYPLPSAAAAACGDPSLARWSDNATFLYWDCNSNRWHLRIAEGGNPSGAKHTGVVTSDRAISGLARANLESGDYLNGRPFGRIDYSLWVAQGHADGFDFTLAPDAKTCLEIAGGDANVLVGSNRTVVRSPFDLKTLGPCSSADPDDPTEPEDPTEPGDPPPPDDPPPPVSGDVSYQTVRPRQLSSSVFLPNPGKGYEQAGKLHVDGKFNYYQPVEDDTDITYIRLAWSNLERDGDNRWNWADLDAAINNVAARGKQAGIGIISWNPSLDDYNYRPHIPDWYMNDPRHKRCTGAGSPAGCTYYRVDWNTTGCPSGSTCKNLWAFNHDDPVFVRNQVELIEALRQHYDNPTWAAKVAYIDVRSIGAWSESHTHQMYITGTNTGWPMPKWENHKPIIDAHLEFEYIPQLVNILNGGRNTSPNPYDYACREAQLGGQMIGWRNDGFEWNDRIVQAVWAWSDAARDCWKTGPIFGESVYGSGISPTDLDNVLGLLTDYRASGYNNKWVSTYPDNPSYTATVDRWLLTAGYRLYVPEAMIPRTAPANATFAVEVDLANAGLAPMYRHNMYGLKLRFTRSGDGTQTIVPLSGDLREVRPDEPAVTFTGTGRLAAGTYAVSVGIIQDPAFGSAFPIKLAQDSASCHLVASQWWCDIGSTTVQ